MRVSAKAMIYAVQRMLTQHEHVIVWMIPGNHDPETSQDIALALSLYYENNNRVTVDLSPTAHRYHLHGKVLIGAHHGDKTKFADLPLLMAVDKPLAWGASAYRYWYSGHVHHDSIKEIEG